MQTGGQMAIGESVMEHKAAILSGAAAVLLISVTGCFSQQHNSQSSGSQGAQAQGGAGGAHVVAASWTPGNISWGSGRPAEIMDPALGETAFTVSVPADWKSVGLILRPGGCYHPAVAADGLSYTVLAPDGYTAVGQLPGASWSWSPDGSSPQGQKCAPIGIDTAAGFLLEIAVPNMHPDGTSVSLVPPTPQMQHNLELMRQQANQRPTYGAQTHSLVDTGRVRVQYMIGDQPMEEMLFARLDCTETTMPAFPALHRAARTTRNCSVNGISFKRAPKGHLDALLASNPPGAKIDSDWDQRIQKRMLDAFAQYQKASDAQFASIQAHFRQVTDGMVKRAGDFQKSQQSSFEHAMAADRATQDATDHAAHLQVLDSLNRQDFIDPSTGRKIETSNQYTHNWISSDKNSVVLGDSPTFDPNGVVDPVRESWTELIPAP
jgi:hypothetical protein